jgi:hypothetical protein
VVDSTVISIAGAWTGTLSIPVLNYRETDVLSLTQSGTSIGGTYTRVVTGDSPVCSVTGVINGTSVSLTFKENRKGGTSCGTFFGTVSADGHTMTSTPGSVGNGGSAVYSR